MIPVILHAYIFFIRVDNPDFHNTFVLWVIGTMLLMCVIGMYVSLITMFIVLILSMMIRWYNCG